MKPLRSTINTPGMARRVRAAFNRSRYRLRPPDYGERQVLHRRRIQVDYEHGQWWVTDLDTGAQWSVVDVGTPFGDAFDFEQVTRGDE